MGLDLHCTILPFFEERMEKHSHVASFKRLSVEGEYIYEIKRLKFHNCVKVWLSDAYKFTEMDYYNRPKGAEGWRLHSYCQARRQWRSAPRSNRHHKDWPWEARRVDGCSHGGKDVDICSTV